MNYFNKNISNLANICSNIEITALDNAKDQLEKLPQLKIGENYEYNLELDKFYKSTEKDQMAVETVVINWIPKDFETRSGLT